MTDLRTLIEPVSPLAPARVDPSSIPPPRNPLNDLMHHLASALGAIVQRDFAISLSHDLRDSVQVTSRTIETINFGQFLKSVPSPRCFWPLGNGPAAAVYISPSLTFGILAKLLGGTDPGPAAPIRSLTVLEQRLLHEPIAKLAHQLAQALAIDTAELAVDSCTSESSNLFASPDSLITIELDVKIAGGSGTITLALRTQFLQQILDRAIRAAIIDRAQPAPALANARVQMCAIAATTTLSPEELRELRVGDIITTGAKGEKAKLELDCGPTLIADVVQFRGRRAIVRTTLQDTEAPR